MQITQNSTFEYYKLAIEARNLELKLFWQRSLFFGGFIAAIFIAFYNIGKSDFNPFQQAPGFFRLLLLILGMLFSLAWSLGNRGSKYWYESWENKIAECERILGINFFQAWVRPQSNFWLYRGRLFSVSKIAIYLSDLTFVAWLVLLINCLDPAFLIVFSGYYIKISVAGAFFALMLFLLFYGTRSKVPPGVRDSWYTKNKLTATSNTLRR